MASTPVPSASQRSDPFEASSTAVNTTNYADSVHIVTIPVISELFNSDFLDAILPLKLNSGDPTAPALPAPTNAFMTALREDIGNRALTTNGAEAFASTLDPNLDFFSIPADSSGSEIHERVEKSWEKNPELTLRLIFNLRSIHEGKAEKASFYHAFGWLISKHPRTAIVNLQQLVDPVIERKRDKKKKTEDGEEVEGDEEWTDLAEKGTEDKQERKDYRSDYSHGYWKDLLNILILASKDQLSDPTSTFPAIKSERPGWTYPEESQERKEITLAARAERGYKSNVDDWGSDQKDPDGRGKRREGPTKREKKAARPTPPLTPTQIKAQTAQKSYDDLVTKLEKDKTFRALYIAVARTFAARLGDDLAVLKTLSENKLNGEARREMEHKIGLCSKWAPTVGGSADRATNIATAIAQVLHSFGAMSELPLPFSPSDPLTLAQAHILRSFYRRWIISPLRKQSEIPELYMSSNEWSNIKYSRVSAIAMRNSKKQFYKHDTKRFTKYLRDVQKGNRKIAGATLLPHELLREAISLNGSASGDDPDPEAVMEMQVINSQWNALIERLSEVGSLRNCLAICDVSGSMGSIRSYRGWGTPSKTQPIWVSLALSIIVAKLAAPPFANSFITFSATPELLELDPKKGLVETAEWMVGTEWGMNTDFEAVFMKLILPLALKHKIPKDQMIKRLFVFSDMQFDESFHSYDSDDDDDEDENESEDKNALVDWTTTHQKIKKAYNEAGYDVPEIVYWNLADGGAVPVTANEEGVAVLSGQSPGMLKLFMDNDEEELVEKMAEMSTAVAEEEDGEKEGESMAKKKGMDPMQVMRLAVEKKSYDGLKVID